MSVNESTAHLTSLLTGLGITQTLTFMAQPYIERGTLVPVLTAWTRKSMPLHVVYLPNRHLNTKLRAFIDWTVELFSSFSGEQA